MNNICAVFHDNPPATSRTDWDRIDAMTDDDIDTSDIPPLTEEELARSWWRFPKPAPPPDLSSEGRLS